MSELVPAEIESPSTADDDPRIGHLLSSKLEGDQLPRVVIIGFPSDEGVRRNGGRTGAAQAPDQIRRALYKMTPDAEEGMLFKRLIAHTRDLGNVQRFTVDLESNQELLGKIVVAYLEQGVIPIILGGGHETAFGHFLGYAKAGIDTSILNMDAHTDVRSLIEGKAHSGSPFRQAIEHTSGCCKRYMVSGIQPYSVSKTHLEYIEKHNGQYQFKDETNITSVSNLFHTHESDHLMVTFDMDAVDQAFAPGVSAPCTNGLHPDLWLTAAYLAGRNEQVSSFDLSEVNPEYDRDGQTARLAALTVWHFLLGVSQRGQ